MSLSVVILAAGKGTRMRSSLPKVLHAIADKPMVSHVINAARQLNADNIYIVYGFGGEVLKATIANSSANDDLTFIEQKEQLGTGHAVDMASPFIKDNENVLVLYGDVPLTKVSTLEKLLAVKPDHGMGLLTVNLADPTGYGRIMRKDNAVVGIIEQKDASAEQLLITEANTGILLANGGDLKRWLANLSSDNAQGEYYLTDIIAACHHEGKTIATAHPDTEIEVEGANNRVQLASLERAFQLREAEALMIAGASLRDPNRIDIRGNVVIGEEVHIDINCIFEGDVSLASGVQIGANCILKNCTIGENSIVKANSIIEDAVVGKDCSVGPFARLRPGSVMNKDSHVGNFVEMKKTTLGAGSKAGHLTYLGDTIIGQNVNIGAGTITCNYDGVNKFKTIIDDGAFVGSNSSLVAPVTIGANATIGAGSVIAKDVAASELAVARGKQRNITGWQRPTKKS
ncbi:MULTISPECIES: bifunctional UDP-N-acetylglucosamine diphosphorylase/glucosamine-1-phosphate N-acetyltransferase GlmU [unclassified Colwellia]|uniref:bifunctional UDP-N-acetylglucosamine diphosphorylase/glucosamine-1-phosphate N-acetyltransferase GlmU n=1 Tax=unclassified Colwellia TaxID=196834 RepID=UPI0015F4B4C8|nr:MULTISPECIES: bifunctional UDP-N-acetylglucosamine diphosphorylase/glucosamine-1-phosphate N-acetyltransferase GlmU [unclassified Colwellia]MBA6347785.1 bifunctional UDP-N-acetylglucosamine diphosphorylase/glucosamine-1-phosphate N-acetyltransferase GlmU [Colwellia sp. BRX8-9]MBA6365108.1 bifunctional UDP-N-acetylglucosamine diphosphorylase/glucosamine-1-phosphate N-acetyltransferase GlmU [Colwellia sp. BRX8-8]MBA6370106.1 bifunctional UDP-N-acetylglucosamine diphosphorylase/glucosamine-1-pho